MKKQHQHYCGCIIKNPDESINERKYFIVAGQEFNNKFLNNKLK